MPDPGANRTTPEQRWHDAVWAFASAHLPRAPARVLEIGCGPRGGLIPHLDATGYSAVGVDPDAPPGTDYQRVPFEAYRPDQPVHAVIACTSLHHLPDLQGALDQLAQTLTRGGSLVVVEWAWERFDEATARWCFARLAPHSSTDTTWLHELRDGWAATSQPWTPYLADWAQHDHLHPWRDIERALTARFDTHLCTDAPAMFADLPDTTEQAEYAAISTRQIRATGVHYVGRRSPANR